MNRVTVFSVCCCAVLLGGSAGANWAWSDDGSGVTLSLRSDEAVPNSYAAIPAGYVMPGAFPGVADAGGGMLIRNDAWESAAAGCESACPNCGGCGCGKPTCSDCQRPCRCDGCCLLGLLKPSDLCYHDFISPMSNPYYFEDPRALTEARLIFANHVVPGAVGGSDAQLFALQLRAKLTDRLSLTAVKDGYMTSSNPLIRDGWMNVAAGIKYKLFDDPERQRIVSAGVWYEAPVGSPRTLQGRGSGDFNVYVTGGAELAENWHWISVVGYRLPSDNNTGSQMLYWSNHFDAMLTRCFYAFCEFNWFDWTRSGKDGFAGIEGLDVFDLGSTNVTGHDIVTGVLGLKYKPEDRVELGVAWEVPLTDRRDILDNRLYADVIFRY